MQEINRYHSYTKHQTNSNIIFGTWKRLEPVIELEHNFLASNESNQTKETKKISTFLKKIVNLISEQAKVKLNTND